MATFRQATYNAARYAAARPTYPPELYESLFKYHATGHVSFEGSESSGVRVSDQHQPPRWDTVVDLGCGTGQATAELAPRFKRVIGVDPSGGMLDSARAYVSSQDSENRSSSIKQSSFQWVKSPAEELGFLDDESVDCVVSAQAAHWFDWHKLWPELARVLRPSGTIAIWGYSQFRLPRYPDLAPFINDYAKGTSPSESLGPYWEQPGRDILDGLLADVPRPFSVLSSSQNCFRQEDTVYFTGEHYPPPFPPPRDTPPSDQLYPVTHHRPPVLRTRSSWDSFETYLRTWSSLHEFSAHNPDDASREGGDIVNRFMKALRTRMRASRSGQNADEDEDEIGLDLEWPMAMIMVKKD